MRQYYFVCILLSLFCFCYPHTHHLHDTQKERESDGSFSPRDHSHFGDDGAHNSDFDHESILGSAKEADEFDDLPPAEAKRRLEILLHKMDLNKDVQIDRRELHSWILRSFRMLSEEESEERMEEVDENEDGHVTWEEYIHETYGIKDPADIPLLEEKESDEEKKLLKEDRLLFNTADKDVDGRLDVSEFLAFTHPEEDPDMLSVILQQTLEDKDKDSDGLISFQEFIGEKALAEGLEKLPKKGRALRKFVKKYRPVFKNVDQDSSGQLDWTEIRCLADMPEDIAEDEVTHLFAKSDDDHDEYLSFAEILEHHDVFVGSEAMDYGDHLTNMERFMDEL